MGKLTARQLAERDMRAELRKEGKTFINLSQKQWNSYCFYTAYGEFLSYSFCRVKEDLATEEGMLPNPPMEIEFADNATIGEVTDLIDSLSDSVDESTLRIQQLLDTGKTSMIKEY